MERERKFLVKYIPDLTNVQFGDIIQFYLSFTPELRARAEKSCGRTAYMLTAKAEGDAERADFDMHVSRNTFSEFCTKSQGLVIKKKRHYIPLDKSLTAELDIYTNIKDLVVVEVEFNSTEEMNKFDIPDWFGEEITYNKAYKNKNLARNKGVLIE